MFSEPSFDLAQFDAETADLDLKIVAAQKLDVPVRQPAAKIAGAVHPCFRFIHKRISKKLLRRQFCTVQISTRYARSTYVQFPSHSHRNRLSISIQNIDMRIGDRSANRDCGCEQKSNKHVQRLHLLSSVGPYKLLQGNRLDLTEAT
jgi:hypothetical protein